MFRIPKLQAKRIPLGLLGVGALAVLIAATIPAIVRAHDHCCEQCGAGGACRVCRVVCDIEEQIRVEYGCECEEFCVPGPSSRCVSADCEGKKFVWHPSSIAHLKSRKKLVRHERKVQKPVYRWEIQYLCPRCSESPK